jgi:starch phosphorylase
MHCEEPIGETMSKPTRIAYFSMEIAMEQDLPTYAGGLGILAGDTLRSAADMGLPMCGVTLIHRKGYFRQRLDESGWQFEEEDPWDIGKSLKELSPKVSVRIDGRDVHIRCWLYEIHGASGGVIPIHLLDTDLEENSEWDRRLTDRLYLGDHYLRLCQEVILGQGGVRMLKALGHGELARFHMNEGHAACLGIELLHEEMEALGREEIDEQILHNVRAKCVFTTHTPVPAGHDQFDMELVRQVLGHYPAFLKRKDLFQSGQCDAECLNMTHLALHLSHYVNGVAKRHAEVSRLLFAHYSIDAITNGVHPGTWVSPAFNALFERYVSDWRKDSFNLRSVLSIPDEEIWRAHKSSKDSLLRFISEKTGKRFSHDILTLGFARRAAAYKRPGLLFEDRDRLAEIAKQAGGLQLVYAGKAHPGDDQAKFLIQETIRLKGELADRGITLVYLPDYDMGVARLLTSGVDVWLNTPQAPMEASGTSGMKAALNGVPSLSILDGWWIEGCIEGLTGWAIEGSGGPGDADALYDKLQNQIVPMYLGERNKFIGIMRHSIALNGAFFNTQRMLLQYLARAYFP